MAETPTPETPPARTGERIAKLLARAGIASRREVERMIAEGRVKLNDVVLTTPATVLPNLKGVTVDDKGVKAAEAARLFLFHKPAGLLTAERDSSGRPTIYAALRNALPGGTARMMPVGRLDFNTEGLLLLTNDGELKRAMELPSSGIPRTYRARTFGTITQEQLESLSEGIEIDGFRYGSINANMERSTGRNQWVEVTITEGKNREVRRVLEHLGLEVSRLIRTAYGPFKLLDLPRGAAVEIRAADVEKFTKALSAGNANEIASLSMRAQAAPAAAPESSPKRAVSAPAPAVADRPRTQKPGGGAARPGGFAAGPGGGAARPAGGAARPAGGAARPAGSSVRPHGRLPAPEGRGDQRRSEAAPRPASPRRERSAGKDERPAQRPYAIGRSAGPPSSARAPRTGPAKPARPPRKSDERDRGEKLIDRPKTPRKPSGWAKAKAKPSKPGRKPGSGRPAPNKPEDGQ